MTETCYGCGHKWGVTVTPRERVLCGPCARPTPQQMPATYWRHRAITGWGHERYRSPEWWDQQTSMTDLRHAAGIALELWPNA